MMRSVALMSCLLVYVSVLSGCGKAGNPAAYQAESTSCSKQFVDDYNSLVTLVAEFKKKVDADATKVKAEDLKPMQAKAKELKSTYKDVKCDAESVSVEDGKEKRQKTSIDVNEKLDPLIKQIDELIAQLEKPAGGVEALDSLGEEVSSAIQ